MFQDDTTLEKQSAVYALVVSNIVLINIGYNLNFQGISHLTFKDSDARC
jgi:hypothetical protein